MLSRDRRVTAPSMSDFENPELRPLLSDAEIERLTDPAAYLGSAGEFVDKVVARIASIV